MELTHRTNEKEINEIDEIYIIKEEEKIPSGYRDMATWLNDVSRYSDIRWFSLSLLYYLSIRPSFFLLLFINFGRL